MSEQAQVDAAVRGIQKYSDPVLLAALQVVLEDRPSVVQELADWIIPDRAYANVRLLQDNRLNGTIKSFNDKNGYGFVECPDVTAAFGCDVFVHAKQMLPNLEKGTEVSFAILVNKDRKPQAFDMALKDGSKNTQKGGGGKGATGKGDAWAAADAGAWGPPAAAAAWAAPAAAWAAEEAAWGGDAAWWGGEAAWGAEAWGKGAAGAAWGKGGAKGSAAKGSGFSAAKGSAAWGTGKGTAKGGAAGKAGGGGAEARGPPESSQEMPGITDQQWTGTIKSFNEARGFGFITNDELMGHFGADTFLHKVQFTGFEIGQEVTFEVFLNKDGKPQAKELQSADGSQPAAKRARHS